MYHSLGDIAVSDQLKDIAIGNGTTLEVIRQWRQLHIRERYRLGNMPLLVLSKIEAETHHLRYSPRVYISITDPGHNLANLPLMEDDPVLRLQYYDVLEGELLDGVPHNFLTISLDQARELRDFIYENWNPGVSVIVHCHAGLCRSSATAAALAEVYNGEGSSAFYFKKYIPNRQIYDRLLWAFREEEVDDEAIGLNNQYSDSLADMNGTHPDMVQ